MKAAHYDIRLELGADLALAFQYLEPVPAPIAVSALKAGDFIVYPDSYDCEAVWPVYSVTAVAAGRVRVALGRGLFHEPVFTVDGAALVLPCTRQKIVSARMGVALTMPRLPGTQAVPGGSVLIEDLSANVVVAGDRLSAVLSIPKSDPLQIEAATAVDWRQAGANGFVAPYSIGVVLPDGATKRVLEGTFIVSRTEMVAATANPFTTAGSVKP